MMRETALLTALELRSLWGINRLVHTRAAKEKRRFALLAAAWILLAAMVWGYVWLLVMGLCTLGLADIVAPYLAVLAAALVFVVGLFRDGHVLFSRRGYDILLSLPVRPQSVVASRFLRLYAENLLLTLGVMVPGLAALAFTAAPGITYYLAMAAGAVLLPLLPLSLSAALGTAILALSSRMRRKSTAQILLSLLLVGVILAGSTLLGTAAESLTPELLANLAGTVNAVLERVYPPAAWLGLAALGNWRGLLWLTLVSVAAAGALLWWVGRHFRPISLRLQTTSARHDYELTVQTASSLLAALFRREWKRYTASSIYVTNTIIGPFMTLGLAIALAVAGEGALVALGLPVDVESLLPFVLAAPLVMMSPTACALSMEGKEVWRVQTLPIPAVALVQAKMGLHLALWTPFWLLSAAVAAFALGPGLLGGLWLFLVPLAFLLFASTFGLAADVHLHRFDWEREEAVVKQGAAAMVGGLVPAALAVAAAFGAALVGDAWAAPYCAALVVALLAASWGLYRHCCGLRFEKL